MTSQVRAVEKSSPLLLTRYLAEVLPSLMKRFGYANKSQCPRLTKIILNVGTGKSQAAGDAKFHDSVGEELTAIAGQRAVATLARVSIANFKLRQGMKVGWRVTLRGDRMYEFLGRFIHAAVPQIRDFRGLPRTSFDGRGNYTLGMKEQTVFPEVVFEKVVKIHGLDLVIVTTAKTNEEAEALLEGLGFPFRKKG